VVEWFLRILFREIMLMKIGGKVLLFMVGS
jgi:hypothetical protein